MSAPEANHPRERRILEQARIVRTRRWPGHGTTLVSPGQVVQAGDAIAELPGGSEIRIVEAAAALRLKPADLRRHMQAEIGAEVEEGQVIARRGGLFRATLAAPAAGTLLHVDETRGVILIRAAAPATRVFALLRGEVSAVEEGRSVEITTQGAVIQGIWSNGLAGAGTSRLLVSNPEESTNASLVTPGMRGTIVVVGAVVDRSLLERAQGVGVAGVVAGSMDGALLPLARRVDYPVLLTEGFGELPLNEPSFRLLADLNGREACAGLLSGDAGIPEILVVKGGVPRPHFPPGPLAAGDRVRVLSAPHTGQMGTVEESAGRRAALPNHVRAAVCTVRLDRGVTLQLPYPNVERIVE